MEKKCKNCIFARWYLTPNGNPRHSLPGECTYKIPPLPDLPEAMQYFLKRSCWPPKSNGIWVNDNSGATCNCFKPKIDTQP